MSPSEEYPVRFHPYSLKAMLIPLLKQRKVAQAVKWSVYSLIMVNFGIYAIDDWQVYNAALASDATLDKVLETFATTIDMAAWVVLVVLFELETYILPDDAFKGWTIKIITVIRAICYVMIIYAAYGYIANTLDNYKITLIPEVTNLCDIAKDHRSLQINIIDFEDITPDNCADLSGDTEFFKIDQNISLIGKGDLPHVQNMGWLDIINAFVWIVVVLLIEFEVALQNADRFGSKSLAMVRRIKTPFYGVLFMNAGIWAVTGYPVYAWDALLWIVGFWAIELNLAEWEKDRTIELSTA
jgi:hypothetical protein|tara:strand:+ start:180 stop:1073 length:894 start_codon:yes stop_codon:yes gene_type:complete